MSHSGNCEQHKNALVLEENSESRVFHLNRNIKRKEKAITALNGDYSNSVDFTLVYEKTVILKGSNLIL